MECNEIYLIRNWFYYHSGGTHIRNTAEIGPVTIAQDREQGPPEPPDHHRLCGGRISAAPCLAAAPWRITLRHPPYR